MVLRHGILLPSNEWTIATAGLLILSGVAGTMDQSTERDDRHNFRPGK